MRPIQATPFIGLAFMAAATGDKQVLTTPEVHKTFAKTLTSSCAVQTTLVEPTSGNNELELALSAAAHSSSLFSSVASV